MGRYLIIHRQYFDESTRLDTYKTYGTLDTVRSHIGLQEFNNLLTNHVIIKEENIDITPELPKENYEEMINIINMRNSLKRFIHLILL